MPRYNVMVSYTMKRNISVYADDESEAEEKACDVVNEWKDVIESEALEVKRHRWERRKKKRPE